MFKKFNPKEDVSGSTSLKSSVQRNIRNQLLSQLPYLALPVSRGVGSSSAGTGAATEAANATGEAGDGEDDGEEEEEVKGKKSKGKGKDRGEKGGKGKSKKAEKLAKRAAEEDEAEAEGEEGAGTVLDEIWPKKDALGLTKCHERISIYTVSGTPIFFNHFDGPFIPTLKLLHTYPNTLPQVQIDRGAIKFLLSGANMMAPGFLSPGGRLPPNLKKDDIVAIQAEGKVHACGIGKMMGSSAEIRDAGKGVAVEVLCWIGDDLWKVETIGI